jgi:glycosyltransferase family protein
MMAKDGRIRTFWRNLKFLSRQDLRSGLADFRGCHAKLRDMFSVLPVPDIRDFEETARMLCETDRSIARFGDGEFAIAAGRGIAFQSADANLAARLRDILASPPAGCEIALPRIGWRMDSRIERRDHLWWMRYMRENGLFVESLLDMSRTYYDNYVSQFSQSAVPGFDRAGLFSLLRSVWDGKDLLIVCGKGIFDGFRYDIFDNAASVEFVYGPKRNAWSEYPGLLDEALRRSAGRLALAVLGPSATVMAADFAKRGKRLLDLGHLAKSYDRFMRGSSGETVSTRGFYRPD